MGTTGVGGLSGGISAKIMGGNFWDGARNGAISAGLNHAYHTGHNGILQKQLDKVFKNYPKTGDYEMDKELVFGEVSDEALKLHRTDPDYDNACATRLSLAFVRAGIKLSKGYVGLIDDNGNRIIISAARMNEFMMNKYGSMRSAYSQSASKKGIYIGITKPSVKYSGHVTIISPGFNSNLYISDMKTMNFWSVK